MELASRAFSKKFGFAPDRSTKEIGSPLPISFVDWSRFAKTPLSITDGAAITEGEGFADEIGDSQTSMMHRHCLRQ